MRTLRTLGLLLVVLFAAGAARADDTKPPNISEVKAAARGGSVSIEAKITDDTGVLNASCFHRKAGASKWEESPMTKNEFDDGFKVTFPGGGDTEYYLQATDILGNGPASYGGQSKPYALGGKAGKAPKAEKQEVAQANPPPPPDEPKSPPPPSSHEPKHTRHDRPAKVAKAEPPQIVHRKPSVSPTEGQDFVLRVKVTSEVGIKTASAFVRPLDRSKTVTIPLLSKGDDQFTATIPASLAKGSIEYLLAALDTNGQRTNQGDGGAETWFRLDFKPVGGVASAAKPADAGASQLLLVSSGAVTRAEPRKPIVIRAQVSPGNIADITEASAADAVAAVQNLKVRVLWREKDGEDQETAMAADPTGGLGGYGASLAPQLDGTIIYYQVVACAADGSRCAVDTGGKKKWNPLVVSVAPAEPPPPLEAASAKAPAGLPE